MERLELTILRNLVFNEDYARKVIPFIQPEYYEQRVEKIVFEEIVEFIVKYGSSITIEALNIEIDNRRDLTESENKEIVELLSKLNNSPVDKQWILDTTEKWCRDRAIYLALMESIHIADGKDDKKGRDAIPSILSDALAVSFDNNIGHDYLQNYEERYEYYHRKEDKIPFDLEYFNKITGGGLPRKTLNILMSGPNVGKTLAMCHIASSYLLQSKNVLYITLEMAEEEIAKRIDANILNVPINQLEELPKSMFENKVKKLLDKTKGNLVIKQYPTASAHSGHFKALVNELALKKSFKPDVIFIDYLNICASSRFKAGTNVNSYSYVKSIAEEVRGMIVELDVPLITATQTTRCLGLDTLVIKNTGEQIEIQEIKVGDEILSHSGNVLVEKVFPIEVQDVYEIVTKSGKKILCSDKHIFPTIDGEKNIISGLTIGDKLFIKK
jgi:replicative DNA helicase